MGSKKTVKSTQTNTLPSWLVSPYQSALSNAQTAAQQPAVSSGTREAINRTQQLGGAISQLGGDSAGMLSGIASGNFGAGAGALTRAADGDFLASNPFARDGQPSAVSGALKGFATNGGGYAADAPNAVSGALSGFAGDGGLDTSYIDSSALNRTASGAYLSADDNPYIRKVAQQGGDAAQAAINAQFGNAGRSNGSGLYAQLFGEGISRAANDVYAQNYANERQLQQAAQGALLNAEAGARENALGRQYGAANSLFGAENAAAENASTRNAAARENALGRQYGAASSVFGAENASGEQAAARQANAYEAERARQQAASGGLLDARLSANAQLPSIISAILSGNASALAAGEYGDNAELNQAARYQAILSQLATPFGMSSGSQVQSQSGLGSILGTIAQLGGASLSFVNPPKGVNNG